MANLMLPGNPRYQPQSLVPFFGYDNLFRTVAEVEIATLRTLGEFGVIPLDEIRELTPDDERLLLNITTSDVVEVERKITKHDLRAWVRIASARLSAKRVARWLHIPLTSYDALDTARVLQFARAHQQVVASQLRDVIRVLIGLVRRHAVVLQIGRTHGQHALPITVGFWLATILNRLMSCARALDQRAADLVGKISGAVGAHNAQVALGLVSSGLNRPTFEECVLHRLGLRPASISTQILPPEPLARYLFECCLLSATLGQFGRDCRNLMRSEIREVAEQYEAGQVGSSTMAHKRNPVTFENLEGTWLKTKNEFGKVLDTLISEHQRDLVGSSLLRDDPTIIVNLVHQLESLLRTNEAGVPFLRRLTVDEAACRRHFNESAGDVLAEPLYIFLQMAGYPGDAHELVNHRIVPLAKQNPHSTLLDAAEELAGSDPELAQALQNIPEEQLLILRNPSSYLGDAVELALRIADAAEEYLAHTV